MSTGMSWQVSISVKELPSFLEHRPKILQPHMGSPEGLFTGEEEATGGSKTASRKGAELQPFLNWVLTFHGSYLLWS